MTLSRRLLFSSATALAAAGLAPAAAQPARPAATPPAMARFQVGRVTVTALSDGFIDAPVGLFTGAPAAELAGLLQARGIAGPSVRLGFTSWLVEDGERRILIDAGAAGFVPTSGRLPAALGALGLSPSDIDLVAITHLHIDHISGLVGPGGAAFPKAALLLPRADVAHFTDPARAAAANELRRPSYTVAAEVLRLYPGAQRIDSAQALSRFVESVPMPGHTPGHTGFRISDGGQSLLVVGDALFDPALHPGRSDIGIAFEEDPDAVRAMRGRLFAQAAAEGAALAATHMPFPGVGRIVRDGGALRWVAADFPYVG